jgi:hypothetical protein
MGRVGERRIGELENWIMRLDDRLRRVAGGWKAGRGGLEGSDGEHKCWWNRMWQSRVNDLFR